MSKNQSLTIPITTIPRPPIIVVMGHIDHGKSSLLDYIRKSNVIASESGGITQHTSAYEVSHQIEKKGKVSHITFLDTPGHEAFSSMRTRGAQVADIAILVVSAEDGVKEQTKEALRAIKDAKIPYVVAINKIDKPNANIERTRQNLAENEIYLEGFGGDIPSVPISAKIGTGIPELLDMLLLVAEMENLTGDTTLPANGIIIESHVDTRRGNTATLIITNGTLKKGQFIVSKESIAPVRAIENFLSEEIPEACFSSPIQITSFDTLPNVGSTFQSYTTKKDAEKARDTIKEKILNPKLPASNFQLQTNGTLTVPIIIKSDVAGTLEAIEKELSKIKHERIEIKIIGRGVGAIGENDTKIAAGTVGAIILGFNTKIDRGSQDIAERFGVTIKTFNIIYELSAWVNNELIRRTPKILTEKIVGTVKILRIFSTTKNKQVVGGKVLTGNIEISMHVKIMRREINIGNGTIEGLQQQKLVTKKVDEGNECGIMVESKIEISVGDILEAYIMAE